MAQRRGSMGRNKRPSHGMNEVRAVAPEENIMELNNIYNTDCLEGMKQIAPGSIALVLCDLPYGATRNKWDSMIPLDPLWQQYKRILKPNGVVVLTAKGAFVGTLIESNLSWFQYEWIWEKPNAVGFLNAKTRPLMAHENCIVFAPGPHTYNPQMVPGTPYTRSRKPTASTNYGNCNTDSRTVNDGDRYPRTVQLFRHDRPNIHPTQKPVALFEYFIKTYTNPGEVVLDNCIGSGTTAIACINSGRNFIGFESNPGYHKAAQDRITKHRERLSESIEASCHCVLNIGAGYAVTSDVEEARRYDEFRERMLALAATELAA